MAFKTFVASFVRVPREELRPCRSGTGLCNETGECFFSILVVLTE